MHKQEQIQQVAQKMATQKQQEKADDQATNEKEAKDWSVAIENGFKQSNSRWVEAFRSTSTTALRMIASDVIMSNLLNSHMSVINTEIKNDAKIFPTDSWKWLMLSAKWMMLELKYLYFSNARAMAGISDKEEQQKYADSLNTIKDAIDALVIWRVPNGKIVTRTNINGIITSKKYIIEQNGNYFTMHEEK